MMRRISNNIVVKCVAMLLCAMCVASCSTTSRLVEGEQLYTGVKTFKVTPEKGEKVPDEVDTYLFDVINVKPNNSLYSPYLRTPFPLGLWVYNNWDADSKGVKGWLYDKLVEQPVVIDDVNPSLRVGMMKSVLDNNGYFSGTARYELVKDKKNAKKAKLSYYVNIGKPYLFSRIEYINGASELEHAIDSIARRSEYLKPGQRYITDSLSSVREVIASRVRNMGYYYFQPDFIEYLADSTENEGEIALRITLADNIKKAALKKYYVGDVEAVVNRPFGRGTPDTLEIRQGTLIKMLPMRLRDDLVPSCLRFRKGRIIRVRDIDQTQLNLSRMGIFSTVNIDVTPLDSLNGRDSVDVKVNCTLDQPMEAAIEFQATSKSNSYIGPAVVGSLTNKNLFGGGELLTTQITAGYEWQTGSGSRENNTGSINSYEFGLNSTLSFPRLLAPKFIDRSRRYINWTRVSLSADLLNRPSYFKMVQFGAGFSWEWHANRNSLNEFTPFKLTYTKMLSTTDAFNAAMEENPAVALSFKDQFVPLMSYSYTYDKQIDRNNNMVWTSTVMEAGNIFSGIWSLAGKHGEKELFGTPFSQFVKAQTQLVYSCKLFHHPMSKHWMVFRLFAGAAHAYGNSNQVPYSEQFYIGGANSLRAFGVRAVGPGSYRPAADVTNGYYDQTGTFKLEFNGEYRFPLMGYLHGAIFLDAGNVWLLEKDASRPGGALGEGSFFKQLAVGTGAGLRFDMEMLVLRADLGIGLHAPYDTGKSGYFNMPSFKKSLAFHIAIGYPF